MRNNYFSVYVILFLMFSTSANSKNIDNEWHYSLTPYAWLAGFEGEAGTFEDLPPVFVDISPKEALKDSDSSFMLIFEAKKGNHGLYIDYFYSNSLSDEVVFPELTISSRSRTKSTMFTLAYEREFIKNNKTSLSFLAGARWWQINSTLAFKFANPENNLSTQNTEQWLDPYIGIKGRTYISNSNFYLAGGISFGGFGVNSDSFYDTNINIGYQWTKAIGTAIGYRQYELDYDQNNFIYDVKQAGLQMDLTWEF